jgi:hypothetical protein
MDDNGSSPTRGRIKATKSLLFGEQDRPRVSLE